MIFDWSKPLSGIIDLVRELVPDGDKRAELSAKITELEIGLRMAEINSKTIPWVDALHKMSRSIQSVLVLGVVVGLSVWRGEAIPWETIAAISGLPGAYFVAKGKGQ